jgi:dTDP-4-amino-4,6-dideoxygalactose transaminase
MAFQPGNQNISNARPKAKKLGETSLMFLVDPSLTAEDMQITADKFIDIINMATSTAMHPA